MSLGLSGMPRYDFPRLKEQGTQVTHTGGVCTAIAWAAIMGGTAVEAAQELYAMTECIPGDICWDDLFTCFEVHDCNVTFVHKFIRAPTTKNIGKMLPEGNYILVTRNGKHVTALVDGKIIDWSAGRSFKVYGAVKIEVVA
jgi:hypothetical protein